ncbi:MAG: flagellar protein FlgN [Peptococcaceae bacterium]|jgi:hypothetical protein|nr:flagellar protein FlgN [Peptococcaceae bacterium]
MTAEITGFLMATRRCADQCRVMLDNEREKRQALLSDDIERLESMLQSQQAAIMRLEGLEKRRLDAQAKAGFAAMTAGEILAAMKDGEDKEELRRQVGDMKSALEEIKQNNERALEIARNNLQMMNALNAGQEGRPENQGIYRPGQSGGPEGTTGALFEKKI